MNNLYKLELSVLDKKGNEKPEITSAIT